MGHTVLVVDDDIGVIDGLKRALHKEPYDVLTAISAAEALEILSHAPVDVIISDEKMPGMSGLNLLAIVARDYPNTVPMLLTGHATTQMAVRAINEGLIYRFFMKPCNEADLAASIRHVLRQKDLLCHGRRLLLLVRRQYMLLQELEEAYPGITKVKRDHTGAVVLDDTGDVFQELMKQTHAEIRKTEPLFDNPR